MCSLSEQFGLSAYGLGKPGPLIFFFFLGGGFLFVLFIYLVFSDFQPTQVSVLACDFYLFIYLFNFILFLNFT